MVRRSTIKSKILEKWDKKHIWHPFTQHFIWEKEPTLIVESGKGVFFRDVKGRRFLDGVSSLWVNIHGHREPKLDQAIIRQIKKISHSTFLGLSHPPAILLARQLSQLAPKGLPRVFYSDNGATSVEVALKMAFQYWVEKSQTIRSEFLALKGSYHGDTIGSVSVGGIGSFHSKFKPLLFKTNFAMAPSCVGCPHNKKKGGSSVSNRNPGKKDPSPRSKQGRDWVPMGMLKKRRKNSSKKGQIYSCGCC